MNKKQKWVTLIALYLVAIAVFFLITNIKRPKIINYLHTNDITALSSNDKAKLQNYIQDQLTPEQINALKEKHLR